jgi:ABC-type Fe3+/spermidine/putrescine transport system ATPase subunit
MTESPTLPVTADGSLGDARAVAVQLSGLTKRYGTATAVSDVDLTVHQGELIAVLGASGSGKTTLLRMIAGFESVTEGSVVLFGRDVSRLSPADREIGMVFQNYALLPHLSVRRNVEYGLKMRGWSRAQRQARVSEMLERMRLAELGDRLPRQLSGGQQQRVAIARALAYSPKLLLMDEPMGALDKALKQDLLAEIRRVHREFSTTIFYVTHDREEALTLADRVALMAEAKLVDCAPVQDMYLRPRTLLAASFFAGANLLPVEVVPGRGDQAHDSGATAVVRLVGARHEVAGEASGKVAALAVRPRDVRLGTVATGWNIDVVVTDVVFLGDDVRVVGRLELEGRSALLTAMVPRTAAQGLSAGAAVRFGIDPTCCHVIDKDLDA